MGVATVTGSALRRRELGRCLRSYRDRAEPTRLGLPVSGRRRAPGLRREEVAVLAGVGVTWYTWLEQGRVTVSDQVLDAVGQVLGIDEVGRGHLQALSRPVAEPAERDHPRDEPVDFGALLDAWPADPAALLDARLDLVGVNDAWARVWGGPAGAHVLDHLLDPPPCGPPVADVEPLVRALARQLRMASDRAPEDRRLAEIRERARGSAPRLGPVWDCRGVGSFGRPTVRVQGVSRVGYLLGEAGPAGATSGGVLVLVPGPVGEQR